MQRIKTKVSEKWVDENDILRIRYLEGARVDIPAILQSKAENEQLLGSRKELVLCDARVSFTVTPDAQRIAIKEIINKSRVATAVITNKAYVRVLVNFALRFSKVRSLVKMFNKEDEALKWLHAIKNS